MTEVEMYALGNAIVAGVREAFVKRDERIAALEQKIVRLEALIEAKNFVYVGVFKEGKSYSVGQFCSHSGSLWHCNQFHTTTKPGDGNAAWTLAVKSNAR